MPNIKSLAETLAAALAHVMKLSISDREFYREILQRTLVSAPRIHGLWMMMDAPDADKDERPSCLYCWKSTEGIQFETTRGKQIQQVEKLCVIVKQEQLTLTTGPTDFNLAGRTTLVATAAAPIHLDGVYSGVAAVVVSLDQLAEDAVSQSNQAMNIWISQLELDIGCGLLLFGEDGKAQAFGNLGRSHFSSLHDKDKKQRPFRQHSVPHLKLTWVIIEPDFSQQIAATRTGVSKREYQLLPLLALGKSNDEIASALSISSSTVKNHLDKIFRKIGVSNRHAAAVWWQQRQAPSFSKS